VPGHNQSGSNNHQAELELRIAGKMNKEAFPMEQNFDSSNITELAITPSNERICGDAQPSLDPDSIRRFCQVWGEIGRAILNRRDNDDNAQSKTRFDYPGGCLHQSV